MPKVKKEKKLVITRDEERPEPKKATIEENLIIFSEKELSDMDTSYLDKILVVYKVDTNSIKGKLTDANRIRSIITAQTEYYNKNEKTPKGLSSVIPQNLRKEFGFIEVGISYLKKTEDYENARIDIGVKLPLSYTEEDLEIAKAKIKQAIPVLEEVVDEDFPGIIQNSGKYKYERP